MLLLLVLVILLQYKGGSKVALYYWKEPGLVLEPENLCSSLISVWLLVGDFQYWHISFFISRILENWFASLGIWAKLIWAFMVLILHFLISVIDIVTRNCKVIENRVTKCYILPESIQWNEHVWFLVHSGKVLKGGEMQECSNCKKKLVLREAHHIPIVGLQNSWPVNYPYAGRKNLLNAVAFLYCFCRRIQMSTFFFFFGS